MSQLPDSSHTNKEITTSDEPSTLELARRIRAGDAAAFETLYKIFWTAMYNFSFRYVQSGEEAMDLAIPPLEYRGIIVAEQGCIRVRERNVLRYYARTLAHLLASPSRRTH